MNNRINYLLLVTLLAGLVSCQPSIDKQEEKAASKAQEIITSAIETHGGKLYGNVLLSFDFRDRHYTAFRKNGQYVYTLEFTDPTGQVKDVLDNEGFYREINGSKVELPEEKENAYANSVNSVIYFALLPHGLNDAAVNKEYLGETTIHDQPYHKIKITFDQEGGLRFREAHNVRNINGIMFSDYINYESASDTTTLDKLDMAFKNSGLKNLSSIDLKNITVKNENL
ncbi:MAG: DUF6503 family protein [Anditalea sp.]